MRNDLNVNQDEIVVEEFEEEEEEGELDEVSLSSTDSRRPVLETWPSAIGIVQICSGFVTAILGTVELFVVPLIQYPDVAYDLHLGKDNCFGAGLFAGFLMILTGSTAVRASISRRPTSVRKFFTLTLLTLVIYTGITIVLIIGYSKGWTKKNQYKDGSLLYEVHIFVTISTLLGFMFAIAAFVQYYEVIFFGQYQMCRRWAACACPCVFQMMKERSDSREHLVSSNSSLPI